MRIFPRLASQSGFSLTEVIATTAILSIMGVGVSQLAQMQSSSFSSERSARVAQMGYHEIASALQNPAAWGQTLTKNLEMACGPSAGGCDRGPLAGDFYPLVIYSSTANEKISYDSTDGVSRIALNGGRCPAGTPDPSGDCPFKFVAKWKPVCAIYPCRFPTIEIQSDLILNFTLLSPSLNAGRFKYSTVRPYVDDTIANACASFNGDFNPTTGTCVPRYANESCIAQGKNYQAVMRTFPNGSIQCDPVYTGTCNPLTHVMTGITAAGTSVCTPRVPPATCPVACVGGWGPCSATCGPGLEIYAISTPAANGGAPCPQVAGDTNACVGSCPVDCVGHWDPCSVACGGGNQTYVVDVPASGGGSTLTCAAANGVSQTCNSAACGNVDCAGNFGACDPVTGTEMFNMTQAQSGTGAACPASPRNCLVNCVGSWGACAGSPTQTSTYTQTITAKNGGAACPALDGQTDAAACAANCWSLLPAWTSEFVNRCTPSQSGSCTTLGDSIAGGKCEKISDGTMDYVGGSVAVVHSRCDPVSDGRCNSVAPPTDCWTHPLFMASYFQSGAWDCTMHAGAGGACPVPNAQKPMPGKCFNKTSGTMESIVGNIYCLPYEPTECWAPPPQVTGACGTAQGTTTAIAPTTTRCTPGGFPSPVSSMAATWNWTCYGNGVTAPCSANKPALTWKPFGLTICKDYGAGRISDFANLTCSPQDSMANPHTLNPPLFCNTEGIDGFVIQPYKCLP